MYRALQRRLGPQRWWPARTRFEVMVGAILTQNTAWHNVERAIANLRRSRALSARALADMPPARLARLIRPSGYFTQKAKKLRRFSRWYLKRCGARPSRLFRGDPLELRAELLQLWGIGPETADSILLYAGGRPLAVVDAYTRRILARHGLLRGDEPYEEIQRRLMRWLPPRAGDYNEHHALLVEVGKRWCHRRNPACEQCPLGAFPHRITAEVR